MNVFTSSSERAFGTACGEDHSSSQRHSMPQQNTFVSAATKAQVIPIVARIFPFQVTVTMPSISQMNKTQLLEEIQKLGGVASMDTRRLELQNHLQSLMEENYITSLQTTKISEYQKMTREMTRAGNKKADLMIECMHTTLKLQVNPNHTMVQMRKAAVEKIYLLTQADSSDPVGFGKFASLSYEEVRNEKEYVTWVKATAKEGGCCLQLSRLAKWLEENPLKMSLDEKKGYPSRVGKKAMNKSTTKSSDGSHFEKHSEEGGSSSGSTQVLQQLVGALQELQRDVNEMKADDAPVAPGRSLTPTRR